MTKLIEYDISIGYVYKDENISIEFTIPNIRDLLYFKVFKSNRGTECCRISITKAEYLESDFYLNDTEIDNLISILNMEYKPDISYWQKLLNKINYKRASLYNLPIIHNNLQIPDYNILKENKYVNNEYIIDSTFNIDSEFYNLYTETIYSEFPKIIEIVANKNPELVYFKYYNSYISKNNIRISMLEPKILTADFNITSDDIDFIIKGINAEYPQYSSCWEVMINCINESRKDCGIELIPENLPIPDYTLLK